MYLRDDAYVHAFCAPDQKRRRINSKELGDFVIAKKISASNLGIEIQPIREIKSGPETEIEQFSSHDLIGNTHRLSSYANFICICNCKCESFSLWHTTKNARGVNSVRRIKTIPAKCTIPSEFLPQSSSAFDI